ncbi:MAG: hypothetical protein ACOY0T_38600 [Myxococcota bacterium]
MSTLLAGAFAGPHFSLTSPNPQFHQQLDPWSLPNLIGLSGGACWVLLYVVAVYYGVKNKSFAIPAFAIPFNFSWELLTSFVVPNPVAAWMWVNRVWFAIDCILVAQTLRYGASEQLTQSGKRYFPWLLAIIGCFALSSQYGYILTFQDSLGYEVAFVIDVLMSFLFIDRYFERPDHSTPAFAIAWFKLLGNLGVSIQTYVLFPQIHPQVPSFAFFHVLYVTLFVLDAIYIALLWIGRRNASASSPSRS